jgi:AcrR family transcriptional regulator
MSQTSPARPANRPSRRHEIVRAAVELFGVQPWDLVTIADIVERAGMTAAAFYYHFESKEQLLEGVVRDVATTWALDTAALLEAVQDESDLDEAVRGLLRWLDEHRQEATVFFVNSSGASQPIEDLRRSVRFDLKQPAAGLVRRVTGRRRRVDVDVAALGLVLGWEIAARSMLAVDDVYRVLGPRRFEREIVALSRRAVGAGPPSGDKAQ